MAKPNCIEFFREEPIPILYEDRSVLAIDKPAGWMLVPLSWRDTTRNLQAAIVSSISAGDYWARSRNLKFLKYIHRLDADTSGVLLFAKSEGALKTIADMFESRKMEKVYLAVTGVPPKENAWQCQLHLAPAPKDYGRVIVDEKGKDAVTDFRVVASASGRHLIEARPHTGRQHQIRVHLASAGCPILGDELYGRASKSPMALRAVGLAYPDPFTHRAVAIRAPVENFLIKNGFPVASYKVEFQSVVATPRPATGSTAKNLTPPARPPAGSTAPVPPRRAPTRETNTAAPTPAPPPRTGGA